MLLPGAFDPEETQHVRQQPLYDHPSHPSHWLTYRSIFSPTPDVDLEELAIDLCKLLGAQGDELD